MKVCKVRKMEDGRRVDEKGKGDARKGREGAREEQHMEERCAVCHTNSGKPSYIRLHVKLKPYERGTHERVVYCLRYNLDRRHSQDTKHGGHVASSLNPKRR